MSFPWTQHTRWALLPFAIAAADLDRNGFVDLVTSNYWNDTISIVFNEGAGEFGAATSLEIGSYRLSRATEPIEYSSVLLASTIIHSGVLLYQRKSRPTDQRGNTLMVASFFTDMKVGAVVFRASNGFLLWLLCVNIAQGDQIRWRHPIGEFDLTRLGEVGKL